MATHCKKQGAGNVSDRQYFAEQLEVIESRIDDLAGLLGELIERIDRGYER